MSNADALRGEVWDMNLDPVIGHEQAGARPALVVSVDLFNEGPAELIVVAPITRTARKVKNSRSRVRFHLSRLVLASNFRVIPCDSVAETSLLLTSKRREASCVQH